MRKGAYLFQPLGCLEVLGAQPSPPDPPTPPSSCLLITERRWCVNTPAPYSVGKNLKPVLHRLLVPRGTGLRHPWWACFSKPLLAPSISHFPPPPPSVFLGVTSHLNYLSPSPDLFPQETNLRQMETWVLEEPEQKSENYRPRAKSGCCLFLQVKFYRHTVLATCFL